MNGMQMRGQWNRIRGAAMMHWHGMTGDNLGRMNGRMLRMMGKMQVKYASLMDAAGRRMKKITRH